MRYFGGKKLGIPGLIRSYKQTAINTISENKILTKNILEEYNLFFNYSSMNDVMKSIKEWDLKILENNFNLNCKIKILVPKQKSDIVFNFFNKHEYVQIKYVKSI